MVTLIQGTLQIYLTGLNVVDQDYLLNMVYSVTYKHCHFELE